MDKKLAKLFLPATLALGLTACASVTPLMVTDNNGPAQKVGESNCGSVFFLAHIGDCGYDTAKKNGGITKVHHTDQATTNYYVFAQHKTLVYGE